MRFLYAAGAAVALAACQPAIPDSAARVGSGVGFGDYQSYLREQERQAAAARVAVVPAPQVVSVVPPAEAAPISAIPIATMMAAPAEPPSQAGATSQVALAEPQPTAQAQGSGVSEQDFQTIFARQQAAGTAAAAASARPSQLEPVAAQPLPERPADLPNIVAYALSTQNRVGEAIYRRPAVNLQNHSRNCGQFVSDDLAQEEFLRRGGPQRDPLNLDPDGDGFACWWDPEPFRRAVQAGN